MKYIWLRSVALIIYSILSTSSIYAEDRNVEKLAISVAEEYIRKKWPSFNVSEYKHLVVDKGDSIEVSYPVPEERLGGGPVVVVDKKTLKVVEAYHEQ